MPFILQLLLLAHHVLQALGSWGVTSPESLRGVRGSCVVMPCTFSYPDSVSATQGIVAIWYKDFDGQRTTVYHSAAPEEVDAGFRDRTQLIGDPAALNCTLLLRDVGVGDNDKYKFRFEIVGGDRWVDARGVVLTVTDVPDSPTIASVEEVMEDTTVSFVCSSPYVCPYDSIALQWSGYNQEASTVSGTMQLDTSGTQSQQTLTTSFSWKDHKKKLQCELSVGSLRAAGEITVKVKHAPKGVEALISPATKNIRVGDSVSLTCHVNSSHPEVTTYRWFKNRAALSGNQILTFHSVTRADYGLYYCEVENPIGMTAAKAVTLNIFSAVISASPATASREGSTVTLTCDVPGEERQDLSYTWYKNNVWLKEGAARALVFLAVATSDTGYYSCKVQNDKGSEMSQAISLTVLYPPRTPAITLFQDMQEGKLAIVHCMVDSHPSSKLSLYRDKVLLATTDSHAAPNQRVSITASRNSLKLEIHHVQPEDDGEYECTATNDYGTSTASQKFLAQAARVLISPSAEVREGEAVTLTCVATQGTEEGTIYTWYKNGQWLSEGPMKTLTFPSVSSGDAGAFHCKAQGIRGSNTSPANTLRVLFPPRQPVMSSLLETQDGQLGIIQCVVESDPQADLSLFKGGELVASACGCHSKARHRARVTPSHNSLKMEIQDVVLEDEGTYMCQAINTYGNSSVSMDFTAETAKIAVAPSPEVQEGQGVNLTCYLSSSSANTANYSWYRNGQQVTEGPASALVFQQVKSTDAGIYYCKAVMNQTSKSSSTVSLNVLYAPRNLHVTSFQETERGRLAIIHGVVESNPPAQLSLYKGQDLVGSTSSQPAATSRVSVAAAQNSLRVEIQDVRLEDEGNYHFTASNAYGSTSSHLYFRVQTARVLATPATEVQEGDAVSLTCDVMGSPPEDTVYTWYRNSKRLHEGPDSSLAFPHITSQDAGSYHCRAHSPEAASSSAAPSIVLHVFYPPRKPQMTSFLETQDGQLGILQCTVDSDPQAELSLLRGEELIASTTISQSVAGQRVKVSSTYNHLKVEIPAVVMEDEGEYVCAASNAYGNASSSMNFTAETARVWISPSPDVHEGDAVNLTCAVDSDAQEIPHYTWYKNNIWYSEGPARSLAFPKVAVADAASYHCTVKTPERVRSSSPGTLNVFYPPRTPLVKAFLDAQDGKSAIIICAVSSNPPSEITLTRASELVASSSSQGTRTPRQRLRVSSSPNSLKLEIQDVTLEDEGEYECSAANGLGEASAFVSLRVQTVRVVVQPAPEAREGDLVTLTCEDTQAQPSTVYTWYKNAAWLAEGTARSLVLQGVAGSDAGSYSCRAQTDGGSQASLPITLRVLYAPRKPSMSSFLDTQDGHQAILHCTVDSEPPSDLVLYRQDNLALMASTRASHGPSNPWLSIHQSHNSLKVEMKDVGLGDEGQYVCLANNTYGIAMTSVHLHVETVRITVDPSPEVHEGATVNVTCEVALRVAGDMNFTWYKNSKWLQDGPMGSLLLRHVSSADAGSYHCRVEGRGGGATSALVSVNVLYAPKNLVVSAFLDNQSGKVGIIRCTADSNPRAELALYKEKKLLASTYAHRSAISPKTSVFPSYNTLRVEIKDLVSEDSAEYVCVASNALGNATASSYFSARTLSDLLVFKILTGLSIAAFCVVLLAMAMMFWPRVMEILKKKKDESAMELTSKEQQQQEVGDL
ncbi:sialoadhesin [Alligator mississippiensis]|uniref:sialoadhesin n=1 Tax=Alligator mississippiensis TaxID=8496 RepID=UPI0028773F7E|nr:sialoadhesin [Alligator mississippiensis]